MKIEIESLEQRNLYAFVAADSAFAGGTATANFGGTNETATAVVVTNGKPLVAGLGSSNRIVLARFNTNGTLDSGFDGDGQLILSADASQKIGRVQDLIALSGGKVLVRGSSALSRLDSNGQIDTTFGTAGFVSGQFFRGALLSNGTFVVSEAVGGNGFRLRKFDTNGKELAAPTVAVYGYLFHVNDTRAVGYMNASNQLSVYDLNLKRKTSFGASGTAYLEPTVTNWLRAQKNWQDGNGNAIPTPKANAVSVYDVTPTRDGGFVLDGFLNARSSTAPWYEPFQGVVITPVKITVDKTGKTFAVNSGADNRAEIDFKSNENLFAGEFILGQGDQVRINNDNALTGRSGIEDFAKAPTGGYYVVGAGIFSGSTQRRFTISRTQPVEGSITGVLFNDDNSNKKKDAGETVNAGRVVYIDANNNGKLDGNELQTTTDSTGRYTFSLLGPVNYRVRRVLPTGYHVTDSVFATGSIAVSVGQSVIADLGSKVN
jgi:hypothetical protein